MQVKYDALRFELLGNSALLWDVEMWRKPSVLNVFLTLTAVITTTG